MIEKKDAFEYQNLDERRTVSEEDANRKLDKFMLMETLRGKLRVDRSPYDVLQREIERILDPHFYIFDMSNSGYPNFSNVLTSSKPLAAFDDMNAGIQSGTVPAEQEWFRIQLQDAESPLAEQDNVQDYLHTVTKILQNTLIGSNFYQQVPAFIRSGSRYLTAFMYMERDDDEFVRFTTFPMGSFYVSNNYRGRADTLCREFQLTVRQIVEQFCTDPVTGKIDLDNASDTVRNYWADPKNHEYRLNVINFIFPNPEYDPKKAKRDQRFKKYSVNYYEMTNNNSDRILYEGGSDFFPGYCWRWYRQPSDAYGVDGPGQKARGDILELYESIRQMLNAIGKVIEPPMIGDTSVAGLPLGTTPAFLSVVPGGVKDGKFGPAYQIQPDIKAIRELINDLKTDIEKICMADIFRMLANREKGEMTATEVLQRIKENTNILSPVFGGLNNEWLQPLIKDLYFLLLTEGKLPMAPKEMHGVPLKIDMVSTVAIALKMGEITAYKEFATFIEQYAQADPNIKDVVDSDEMARKVSQSLNISQTVIRGEDKVQALRQQRAQQQAQQQAAERAPQIAKGVKDLAQAPTDGNSALSQLMGQQGQGGQQ